MPQKTFILISKRYWPATGGIETYMSQVARSLQQHGPVTVLTLAFKNNQPVSCFGMYPGAKNSSPYDDPNGICIVPLSPSFIQRLALLPLATLMIKIIANFGNGFFRGCFYWFFNLAYNKKFTHYCKGASAILSFEGNAWGGLASKVSKRLDTPLIVFPFVHPGRWGDDLMNLKLYRKAQRIVTASKCEHSWFAGHGVGPDRLFACGGYAEPIKACDIKRQFNVSGSLILFLGRCEEHKGHNILLDAWDQVRLRYPDDWCAVVGPGFPHHINAARRVIMLPATDGSPIPCCDIFCMPSVSETFGMVYIEAWNHEKPVIACPIPSTVELFHQQEAGILVDQRATDLAIALDRLLSDPPLRTSMGRTGKALVETYYSKKNFDDNINRIIEL